MAWLFLGLVTLPFAALLYVGFQRLAPRLLEPAPEAVSVEPPRSWRGSPLGLKLGRRTVQAVRVGLAVVVVAGIGLVVARTRTGGTETARPVVPAPEQQLPAPVPLQVKAHLGADGAADGQLHDPRDVAVDPSGDVFVADTGNKRVVKFGPDGAFVTSWSDGPAGKFIEPSALAVAKDGLIVDDSEAAHLYKFDFTGKLIPGFEHDLALSHPRGIGAAPDGTVFVADTGNSRILKVHSDGTSAGEFDTKGVKLEQPSAVAFDDQSNVYSIEVAAKRIQKFSPDGALMGNSFLPGGVTVFPPRGMWAAGRGLVVNLPDQNAALSYDASGGPQSTFAAMPSDVTGLEHPTGIAAAPDNSGFWLLWGKASVATLLAWSS